VRRGAGTRDSINHLWRVHQRKGEGLLGEAKKVYSAVHVYTRKSVEWLATVLGVEEARLESEVEDRGSSPESFVRDEIVTSTSFVSI
jgi:hypothetical protein